MLMPALLAAAALATLGLAAAADGKYEPGAPLTLWVNKVGPYDNPTLTYNYRALPFCRPTAAEGTKPAKRFGGLGEALTGNDLQDSQLGLRFRVPVPRTPVCAQILDAKAAAAFAKAVRRRYWYEFFLDDLPVWGFVGPPPPPPAAGGDGGGGGAGSPPPRIFTHQAFTIAVNGPHVVGVNLTTEAPAPIAPGATLAFTYSVEWVESAVPHARRYDTYLDAAFFEHRVHAFSVVNAAMMVVVLLGLTAGVLVKTLRADFRRYDGGGGLGGGGKGGPCDPCDLEALDRDLAAGGGGGGGGAGGLLEETGWKAVHGDVFRTPPSLALLSACAGAGAQLAALAGLTVAAAAAGDLFTDRGAVTSVAIAAYALTAALGGYVSGSHYARHGGRRWVRVALFTACLYPGVVGGIGLVLNAIATAYRSLAAVSFLAAASVGAVWLLCAAPLSLVGTLAGRRLAGAPDAPCRVKRVPSPIPPAPWYASRPALVAGAGALPFGAIFIEIFFLFSALWSYKVYYVFGTLALVLALLIAVSACTSVVATYVLLNAEDFRWQWFSFGCGASVGGWVFAYSAYYFLTKTRMSGLFQTAFFFGHTAIFCVGLGLAMGAVGHLAAGLFVRKIYRGVKAD